MSEEAEKIVRTIYKKDDLLMVILRGHLLIEETVDEIIYSYLPKPEYFKKTHLTFNSKVLIARSMCWEKSESEIWDLILRFNQLRNDFAHKLTSVEREKKIGELISLYDQSIEEDNETLTYAMDQNLCFVIAYILGFLRHFRDDVKSSMKFVNRFLKTKDAIIREFQKK